MIDPAILTTRTRVLHFITHLGLGGAERVTLNLVRGLKPQVDSAVFAVHGVATDAIGPAMQRELREMQTPLFIGTRLPTKWGGMLLGGLHAARAVKSFRPNLIHLHTEIPEASYAAMVALQPALSRIAVVRTIHNTIYWGSWPRMGRWCDRRLAHARIAGVSQGAIDAFNKLRKTSGAAAACAIPRLIFNGVAMPTAWPQFAPRPTGGVRVLFAGRLEPQKGADLLPEILAQVRLPAGISAELSVFGDGAEASRLRALATNPPAGWTVRHSAPVAGLAARLREFDLVFMPSRFEGLSLFAIEAMLAGVPIVAADAPGLREQLPPSHPWRARPGDATDLARVLQVALTQPEVWPGAAAVAAAYARGRFSLESMLAGYRALYREVGAS